MAILPTPTLSLISTFDPSKNNNIYFSYNGNQIKKKRIVIIDNKTFKTILDNTQLGMKLCYDLPANTIKTGQYTAQIQVFDFDGNSSELSQPVLFYCYSTPSVSFSNFTDKINKSSINLSLSYTQAENDSVKEFAFYLYDLQKKIVTKSNNFYSLNDSSYTFLGLKNLTTYYVQCKGTSLHNMDFDTGLCEINVNYIVQPNNMLLRLSNNKCEGYIQVDCNIIDVGYIIEGGKPEFKNGEVILDNKKVTYISGFDFSDNFSMFVKARKIPLDTTFFGYTTSSGNVELSIKKIALNYYCVLRADSVIGSYYRYVKLPNIMIIDENSNQIIDENLNVISSQVTIDDINNYIIVFEVKRKNNLYNLKAYYEDNGYIEIK